MRTRPRPAKLIDDLRLAIDCLPLHTRTAMLEGVHGSRRIIVGAYVDDRGGVCPMLAAHRNGGRTNFLGFAKSWDRFTRAGGARRATARELTVLIDNLEASIESDVGLDLAQVIADHCRLTAANERARCADPEGEIVIRRTATSWLRRSRRLVHSAER
ncbi:MAG TPA: hypothetical protein VID48_00760 [Solirubrobacteraceae bacterium]|jgi:hypothetical protein